MLTPIRPSLSQVLQRSGAGQTAPAANEPGAEVSNPALAARQAFFRQIKGETQANSTASASSPQNTSARTTQTPPPRQAPQSAPRPVPPAVFKAADIERAQAQGETPPPLRPGSLLNIVV